MSRHADQRAPRHTDDNILPVSAGAALGSAHLAGLGLILASETEIEQRGHMDVDGKNDVAALPAVAAVRSAGRDIFFPVKGHAAVAAAARFDQNVYDIDKHQVTSLHKMLPRRTACPGRRGARFLALGN